MNPADGPQPTIAIHHPPEVAAPAEVRPRDDPEFLALAEDEQVEALMYRGWSIRRIAREAHLPEHRVRVLMEHIDEAVLRQVAEEPERIKARHTGILNAIAQRVMDSPMTEESPKTLRVAMQALADIRKIHGLDAPTKTSNVSLNAYTLIQPEDQERFLNDHRIRQAQLVIEQVANEFRGAEGAVPGDAGADRLPGPLEEGQAP